MQGALGERTMMDKVTIGDLITVALFVMGSVGAVARHWWNKHHQRINHLDERTLNIEREMATKVSIQMHNDTIDALRRDILQGNREIREEVQGTNQRLDKFLFKTLHEK